MINLHSATFLCKEKGSRAQCEIVDGGKISDVVFGREFEGHKIVMFNVANDAENPLSKAFKLP